MDDTTHTYDPLERLPDEPPAAHRALIDYEALGSTRTLEQLTRRTPSATEPRPTRRLATLKEWSGRWNWQERIAQMQDLRIAQERAAREAVWAQRREQIRDESWELAQRLRQRATELLDHPTVETVSQVVTKEIDGVPVEVTTVIVKPSRWAQRDIPAIAETFDKLARLSAGMDTEQSRIIIEGLEIEDLESLSDEELQKRWEQIQKKKRQQRA